MPAGLPRWLPQSDTLPAVAPSYPYPFRVTLSEDPEDGDVWIVNVDVGFVNGLPVTIDDVPLYATPAPTLSIPKNTFASVYLEVAPDVSWLPLTSEVMVVLGASPPATTVDYVTPTNSRFRLLLAVITVANVVIPSVGNNLVYVPTSTGPAWGGI